MSTIYYSPANFGLETIGEVEFSSGCYEFDTSVLWRETASGNFYVGDDSGCSCPAPFEDKSVTDLTKITRLQDLVDYFDRRKEDSYRYTDDEWNADTRAEIDGAIGELVQKYLTAAKKG